MEKANVPKFGSFKPKAKKAEHNPEPSSSSDTRHGSREEAYGRDARRHERAYEERKHRKSTHERRRSRDRPYVRGDQDDFRQGHRDASPKHRVRPEHNDLQEAASKSIRDVRDVDRDDSDLFLVDRRGDAKNVEYGSLHRYSIAAYRRTGYGHIIGVSKDIKIDRDASTDKEVCLMNIRERKGAGKTTRLLTSNYGRRSHSRYRFILSGDKHSVEEENSDYIDLRSSRKRRRGSQSPDPATDYRSIEGKAKARPDDEDAAFASDSDTGDIDHDLDLAARQQGAVLSKQLKADPKKLELWLELIEHQAKLVKPGEEINNFTSSERRTLADLRMSIVREALAAIPQGSLGHDQLLLTMIEEGRLVWDSSKRASKWQEALKKCPSSTLLWTNYLDYIQDSSNSFRYDACKEAYVQCLELQQKASSHESGDQAASIGKLQTYVLLRYTTLLWEAGYQELSVSIWQALLEWHYHMPPRLHSKSLQDRLAAFEDFWDSECPRMGEQNAQGWHAYDAEGNGYVRVPPQPSNVAAGTTSFNNFVAAEAEWNKLLHLSTIADDDAAVEDPYRYVMFSDIAEILKPCHALPKLDRTLLSAALCYLGLPPVPSGLNVSLFTSDTLSWYRDAHLAHVNRSHTSTAYDFKVALAKCRHETAGSLYEDAFHAGHLQDSGLVGFVDCLLEQVLACSFDEDLGEYYLAFKWRNLGTSATKAAKALLKAHSTSLRLYNAYAVMLVAIGEGKEMQKPLQIWSTAINMRTGLPEDKQEDVVVLWHSRLICLAKHSPDGRAPLSSLMMICESSGDSRMQQLKVRRELESGCDRMQLAGRCGHAGLYADLLAWLAYLTSDQPIRAALATYQKYVPLLPRKEAEVGLELLLQNKAKLIELHMARGRAYKPAVLRDELDVDLRIFPSNSTLLTLRSRLIDKDRLRALVKGLQISHESEPDIVQWFAKLIQEIRRVGDQAASGATENNIRATFTNAVQSSDSRIKHAPALWMAWLEWEYGRVKAANTDAMLRTKQVVLDGMQHIPWHKGFVLRGLECFLAEEARRVVSRQELRQWYEVLVERGLRISYDLESVL